MAEDFDEVELKVREIIKNVLQVKEEKIARNTTIADLGADSLAALGILSALEQEFGIDISDVEARELSSLESAAKVVKKHKGL